MNVVVAEAFDADNESVIIGVAENIGRAKDLVDEYFGKYELISMQDVRDSGIEYIYTIETKKERYKVVLRHFTLNKL